ncbi:hypothetical protein NEOKW01_2143, partial [Nematocida sp. AWRm80]
LCEPLRPGAACPLVSCTHQQHQFTTTTTILTNQPYTPPLHECLPSSLLLAPSGPFFALFATCASHFLQPPMGGWGGESSFLVLFSGFSFNLLVLRTFCSASHSLQPPIGGWVHEQTCIYLARACYQMPLLCLTSLFRLLLSLNLSFSFSLSFYPSICLSFSSGLSVSHISVSDAC